jgi:histidinol-phosphatase (PHP family)
MALFDQHLHSRHSFDSSTDPSYNVRQALARGLAGLTFTEHFDTHPDDWTTCTYDDDAYSTTMARLREEFGDRIWIGKGIEVCYQPQTMPFVLEFLSEHEFDMVMLSVHYFHGRALHVREGWASRTVDQVSRMYLETVLEAVRFAQSVARSGHAAFHILGHLDLVKRYSRRFHGVYDVSQHQDLLDEILRACLAANLIPEINTSSWRQGLDVSMPGADTVRRFAELGGRAMSLGSDAHRAEDIGAGFDRAVDQLRAAGIPNLAVFINRERRDIPI